MYIPVLAFMCALPSYLLGLHLSKSDVYTQSNTPVNRIILMI